MLAGSLKRDEFKSRSDFFGNLYARIFATALTARISIHEFLFARQRANRNDSYKRLFTTHIEINLFSLSLFSYKLQLKKDSPNHFCLDFFIYPKHIEQK